MAGGSEEGAASGRAPGKGVAVAAEAAVDDAALFATRFEEVPRSLALPEA